MAIGWPAVLRPSTKSWWIEGASRSGGQTAAGGEQVVATGTGRWRCAMTIPAVREDWILSVRAFGASLDGRAGLVEVPVFDVFAPADINGRRVSPIPTAVYGGTAGGLHSDLSGLGQSTQTYVTLAAGAAINATRIQVRAVDPDGNPVNAPWMVPRPGQYFGIGSRLHQVTRHWRVNEADAWTLEFRPWLREAATAGARIITDHPVCTMRASSDEVARLDLEFARFGSASLDLVEAI